jgi:hypothetical protein
MVDLAYDWSLMGWGMRAIVIALAVALILVVLSPHVAVLKPIAQRLGLVQTQTIYVPINHTVVKYVNQTVVRYVYVNKTVPVYMNRTVYVPVGLNESLSTYFNNMLGWNGLRCWIVTFIYDNATPYYYEGNATGSIATIGTMIVPQQLLGRFDEVMHGGGPNGTYYYPYGILQLRGSSLTFIYAFGGSINITEIMPLGGELFIPRNTSVPAVFIFGDWLGVGPSPPTFYYAVINNTGNYIMVEYHGLGVNDYTIMRYNQTYTVLIFTRVFIDDHLTSQLAYPFACNWTIIGPVDPSVIMRYPIPYAWASAEIFAAFDGNLTMSAVEHIYQHNNFGYWVWNLLISTTNTSLPYPTS